MTTKNNTQDDSNNFNENSHLCLSIIDELDHIKAILNFLDDASVSLMATCQEKPPMEKTGTGLALIFLWIYERIDKIRDRILKEQAKPAKGDG